MAKFGFHKATPHLALLTDFGDKDSYVGTMKGVIYSICPNARIVDLTHNVDHQDVTGAAFILRSSYNYFPPKTVFACVVDPGVGSDRDIICMKAAGRIFLAPDNGLLSILKSDCKVEAIRTVENKELWLDDISRTFHGRDIFAPVAAHLAEGADIESVGSRRSHIAALQLPRPVKTTGGDLKGMVVYVDRFGNLITNIGESTLQTNLKGAKEDLTIAVGEREIKGISGSYSDVKDGALVALVGSSGYVEIAVNRGSAKETANCGRGTEVLIKVSSR